MSDYAITFRWNRTVQDRDWPKTNPSRRAIMAVAFIISRYPDKDGSNIECSLNTITTKAGISRRTVIQVLDLFVKESLLQRDGKARGGVIRYRMILGGSEQRLNSTSIPTALCQKDENSITTNDAVRDSLTLAHTADKKTTQPDNFTTIATSTITPTPPQAHDPELLRNDIRTIYANRHVRDSIRKGEFTDLETLRVDFPKVQEAHPFIKGDLDVLLTDVLDGMIENRIFPARPKLSNPNSWIYLTSRRQELRSQTVDVNIDEWLEQVPVQESLDLIDDYFIAASELIRRKFAFIYPQLKSNLYDDARDLYYEGSEIGITLDTDMITLETFNRDINRYINEYNQTHQHA